MNPEHPPLGSESLQKTDETLLNGVFSIRIYYEDTDFSGYVYHANYLKFFERAREELIGVERIKEYFRLGIHFVVARADLKFHRPSQHADLLTIKTKMKFTESPVVPIDQEAWCGEQKVVSMTMKLAAVNSRGEPVRIPLEIIESLRSASGQK